MVGDSRTRTCRRVGDSDERAAGAVVALAGRRHTQEWRHRPEAAALEDSELGNRTVEKGLAGGRVGAIVDGGDVCAPSVKGRSTWSA